MKSEVLFNAMSAANAPKVQITDREILDIIRIEAESAVNESVFGRPIQLCRTAAFLLAHNSRDKFGIITDEELDDIRTILDAVILRVISKTCASGRDWKVIKEFSKLPNRLT